MKKLTDTVIENAGGIGFFVEYISEDKKFGSTKCTASAVVQWLPKEYRKRGKATYAAMNVARGIIHKYQNI